MINPKILVVDDEHLSLSLLEQYLSGSGYSLFLSTSAYEALNLLQTQSVDLVISDIIMPGMDGIKLIEKIRLYHPDTPVIAITANGSINNAVEAMRSGAYDYLEKPVNPDVLSISVQRALNYHAAIRENEQVKELLRKQYSFQNIITATPAMREVLEQAAKVATAQRTTVAIYGESGSGKEVLARAIHFACNGLPTDFVAVNCAAIPDHLLESELFGHVRGAFAGADSDREGKFSLAREGTLLLDEVGDMPLALQAKLLRVLQERAFEKLGSNALVPVRCRIIVATTRNLEALVEAGQFREELYHRINVFPLTIPPLRERKADLEMLCKHFLEELRPHFGKPLPGISGKAMEVIAAYSWPGNVRELHNCLERAAILTDAESIGPEHLGIGISPLAAESLSSAIDSVTYSLTLPLEELALETLTEKILTITLERCKGNKTKAAQMLRINRKAFYRAATT